MMNMIFLFLEEYPIACNVLFFVLVVVFLQCNQDSLRRDRRQNQCRAYQRDGVLCGGVVTHRNAVGDKLYIRYAYRLDNDTAYIKDFVEAPEELKHHHKNIVVVLFPKYKKSGIHYGVLQKLMKQVARNGADGIRYKAFLRLCLLYGVMVAWGSLGPYFFWTYRLLIFVSLYHIWQMHKTEEETTGVVEGVWKTVHRHAPTKKQSWFATSDELDDDTKEDIFSALDESEYRLAKIMEFLDPESSETHGRAFPCEAYFSLASRCQQALQQEAAMFDT